MVSHQVEHGPRLEARVQVDRVARLAQAASSDTLRP